MYLVTKGSNMGKKVYTVNGTMYIIDDETGKIKTIEIKDEPIPQRDLEELIKILAQNQKDD
jgi:peroxiredoxin